MKRILRAIKILEVSGVDKPAQEHAMVLIMKGKNAMTGNTLDELIQEHAAIPLDIRKGDATDYEISKSVAKMVDASLLDQAEKHNYNDLIKMRATEIRREGESGAQAYN